MIKHSPAPWSACGNGECKCKQVWSVTADHPVAVVESGKWGDSHWEAKLIDGEAKLVWVEMDYGEIPEEEAVANARLIKASPELLDLLKRAVEMMKIDLDAFGGCDHSVGVCNCDLRYAIEDSVRVIKSIDPDYTV